jgi:hypothetical protein
MSKFEDLKGLTITYIEGGEGDHELTIETSCGKRFLMYHIVDCCNSTYLSDICGDFKDLYNSPILEAQEVSSSAEDPLKVQSESWTWTFYKLATQKGWVTMRWLGSSNGYYSESVGFKSIEDDNDYDYEY